MNDEKNMEGEKEKKLPDLEKIAPDDIAKIINDPMLGPIIEPLMKQLKQMQTDLIKENVELEEKRHVEVIQVYQEIRDALREIRDEFKRVNEERK